MFRYGDELTNEIDETDFMEISNIKKREKNDSSDISVSTSVDPILKLK